MKPTTIAVTCRFVDRLLCARWARRATRRAGTGRLAALARAAEVLIAGAVTLPLRACDAAVYLGTAQS